MSIKKKLLDIVRDKIRLKHYIVTPYVYAKPSDTLADRCRMQSLYAMVLPEVL